MSEVPFEKQVWTASEVAGYIRVSKPHFQQAIQYMDTFPKPLGLPAYTHGGKERKMDSRWFSGDIIAWVERHRSA